jgi:glycosyltransferase involved in cell wall biosynthesis
MRSNKRIFFASHACYLDDNGPSVTGRALMRLLKSRGNDVEVLCGPDLNVAPGFDSCRWLTGRDWDAKAGEGFATRSDGLRAEVPPHCTLADCGVPVAVHRWPPRPGAGTDAAEIAEFLRLLEMLLDRSRPDAIITPGGCALAGEILARGRARNLTTIQFLHDLHHEEVTPARFVDETIAFSQFAADYYYDAFDMPCIVTSSPIEVDRVLANINSHNYVTFVDPIPKNGVWFFARIVDELGRRRPDIPLLIVEGRGTENSLAESGLDLRLHGNLSVMSPPRDPRDFWRKTRICVLPTLSWDGHCDALAGAMTNGIPIISSNRGSLPEILGDSGVQLTIPDHLTPATRKLPTPEEVVPWVESIIRIWDDEKFALEQSERITAQGRRGLPNDGDATSSSRIQDIFRGTRSVDDLARRRERAVILVPHLNGIDWECEQGLRQLEDGGVKVVRRGGSSAIDVARNVLASDAIHDGFDSAMFIDADIGFDPVDVFRLIARPEPVICGVYAKKGQRGFASHFGDGISEVIFGHRGEGPYPLRYAATGFLRIKTSVLRRMISELSLPLCNTKWGRGIWPFFMPLIVPHDEDGMHYLGEDWAFSRRLELIHVTPLADTSIRLWHWGRHAYGWEDAGADRTHYRTYRYRLPPA